MLRSLFVGDLHTKPDLLPLISSVAIRCHVDQIILLGDLCDDWQTSNTDQIRWLETFLDWYQRESIRFEIIPLLGNHDVPYWLSKTGPTFHSLRETVGFPGFKPGAHRRAHELLHMLPMRVAWSDGYVLATHAGLLHSWGEQFISGYEALSPIGIAGWLNQAVETVPLLADMYRQVGIMRGGDSLTPSPLWADKTELEKDGDDRLLQVVGHTPVTTVTCSRNVWFCDTFSTLSTGQSIGDKSLLLYEHTNHIVTPVSINAN